MPGCSCVKPQPDEEALSKRGRCGGRTNARDAKALHDCDYPVRPDGQNHWSAGPTNKSNRAPGTDRDVRKSLVCGVQH